jgi:hypothetical protein
MQLMQAAGNSMAIATRPLSDAAHRPLSLIADKQQLDQGRNRPRLAGSQYGLK